MKFLVALFLSIAFANAAQLKSKAKFFRTSEVSNRIVGGAEVESDEAYPHQVALTFDSSWICGGSIIHSNWILTAGHCCSGAAQVSGRAGSTNRLTGGTTFSSRSLTTHEDYSALFIRNDVCVIYLETPFAFSATIKAVALTSETTDNYPADGTTVTATGYGKISDAAAGASTTLYEVNTFTIPNADCEAVYGASIVASTLCTDASAGKGVCSGDSGGPLVINNSGVFEDVGVTSFVASAGCESGFPHGFARISSFRQWIFINTNNDV